MFYHIITAGALPIPHTVIPHDYWSLLDIVPPFEQLGLIFQYSMLPPMPMGVSMLSCSSTTLFPNAYRYFIDAVSCLNPHSKIILHTNAHNFAWVPFVKYLIVTKQSTVLWRVYGTEGEFSAFESSIRQEVERLTVSDSLVITPITKLTDYIMNSDL